MWLIFINEVINVVTSSVIQHWYGYAESTYIRSSTINQHNKILNNMLVDNVETVRMLKCWQQVDQLCNLI